MVKKISKYWLKYSVGLTFLCSIHCIATPLFVMFFPFLKNLYEYNTVLEILLLVSVLLLGGSSLLHDFKSHHGKILPILLFLFGYVILVAGHFIFHDHSTHGESQVFDTSGIIVIGGSLLLFVGQMVGIYYKNREVYFSKTSL